MIFNLLEEIYKKDENVHRFVVSAIRVELLERERATNNITCDKKGGQKV